MTGGIFVVEDDAPGRPAPTQQGRALSGLRPVCGTAVCPGHRILNRIRYAWYQTMDFVQLVWFSLGQLVTGGAGLE